MKRIIHTEKAPAALGPYSQGIEVNGVLYVSGQIPFVPETMELILKMYKIKLNNL